MSTFSTISYVHATVGFYHIFLVSLCYENDYLVYIYMCLVTIVPCWGMLLSLK